MIWSRDGCAGATGAGAPAAASRLCPQYGQNGANWMTAGIGIPQLGQTVSPMRGA
jgi:hypothetical protein